MQRLNARVTFDGLYGAPAIELLDSIPADGVARGRPSKTTKHAYVVGYDPHVGRGFCTVTLAVLAPEGAQIEGLAAAYRHVHVVVLEELGALLEHAHGLSIEIEAA